MGTLKNKRLGKVVRDVSDWVEKNEETIGRIDELQFEARIVLKIKRYMQTNGFSQKQLAAKLGVTPQYIHKLLHGEITDMKISTAIRYGKILGIRLIDIAEDYVQKNDPIVLEPVIFTHTYRESNHTGHFIYSEQQNSFSRIPQKKNQYGSRPS